MNEMKEMKEMKEIGKKNLLVISNFFLIFQDFIEHNMNVSAKTSALGPGP